MIEPIVATIALTVGAIKLMKKPYTVTLVDGKYEPTKKDTSFKTREQAVTYAKVMSDDFQYILLKHHGVIERITTNTKE